MIEEVKVGKHCSYVRKGGETGKYFYRQYNQYVHSVSLTPIEFDENGIATVYTSGRCYMTVDKEHVDILFITDGRTLEKDINSTRGRNNS